MTGSGIEEEELRNGEEEESLPGQSKRIVSFES
jgi:hypothetical protein